MVRASLRYALPRRSALFFFFFFSHHLYGGAMCELVRTPTWRRSNCLPTDGTYFDRHGTSPSRQPDRPKHAADIVVGQTVVRLVVHARVARVHRLVSWASSRLLGGPTSGDSGALDRIHMGRRTRAAGLCLLPFRDLHRPLVPNALRRARCGGIHRPLRHLPLRCGPGPPVRACAQRLATTWCIRAGALAGTLPNRLRRVAPPSWPGSSPSCALRDVADVDGNRRLSSWWRAFHRCGCRSRTSSIPRISSP